jgi:hypothetical protein
MAVNATAVWRVRPSGSNTNGGGYDPGISGAATDYSQQNAAQATGSHGTATGTTTFTDTIAANFTAAMVGNALWIASGAGFTVGAYFVTAFTSATQVTLDRSPGTGTIAVWALGGAWADYWTNINTNNPVNGGNQVLILGSGTPNPSSYTYDYTQTTQLTPPVTSNGGFIIFANDSNTPGYKTPPNSTGGMPVIKGSVSFPVNFSTNNTKAIFQGIWYVADTTPTVVVFYFGGGGTGALNAIIFGCVIDQFGIDCYGAIMNTTSGLAAQGVLIGCEIFSSKTGAITIGAVGFQCANGVLSVVGCNIHDTIVGGAFINTGNAFCLMEDTICSGTWNQASSIIGIQMSNSGLLQIKNCTIDNYSQGGIAITAASLPNVMIINNIISNSAGFGIEAITGTAASNAPLTLFIDYNTYYNNTTNTMNLNMGAHDTIAAANPYVGQSTENYTLL